MTSKTDVIVMLYFKFASTFCVFYRYWKREEISLLEAKIPVIAAQILSLAEWSMLPFLILCSIFLKWVTASSPHPLLYGISGCSTLPPPDWFTYYGVYRSCKQIELCYTQVYFGVLFPLKGGLQKVCVFTSLEPRERNLLCK